MSRQLKVCFLSDTHIFYKRSRFAKGIPRQVIEQLADSCDILILGGDIFDFHFAFQYEANHFQGDKLVPKENGGKRINENLRSILRSTVDESIQMLEEIRQVFEQRGKKLLVLVGNHDNIRRYTKGLDKLVSPSFAWDAEYFLIGDLLALHGDLPLTRKNVEDREILHSKDLVSMRRMIKVEHMLHETVQMGWFYLWNLPSLMVPRLIEGCKATIDPEIWGQTKHTVSGHVHLHPFIGEEYDGVFAHHSGASIGSRFCHPLVFTIQGGGEDKLLNGKSPIIRPGGEVSEIRKLHIDGLTRWQDRVSEDMVTRVVRGR